MESRDSNLPPRAEDIALIEGIAHRTWPCRTQESLGDWILREGDGFTRRANSCLALGDPGLPLPQALGTMEQWYRVRNLEPCVKIVPGIAADLDAHLAARGWKEATPSLTLSISLDSISGKVPRELSISAIPERSWLESVSAWDGHDTIQARQHAELALRIQSGGFLRWTSEEGVVALGLVSFDGSSGFLYDVVVHPERRGRGIGRAFCQAALSWASSCGATTLHLQVLESNLVARALYAQMGFGLSHRYHYRVAPCQNPSCGC